MKIQSVESSVADCKCVSVKIVMRRLRRCAQLLSLGMESVGCVDVEGR